MTCAALACNVQVASDKLMCRRHWAMVSPPTQSEVYAAWRACKGTPDRRYAKAVATARVEVAKVEGERAE